jgi:hypothetical protein
MPVLRRLRLWIALLAAATLLAACGGAPEAPAPTAAPAPTPKPTLTPRPTPKPEPTEAPTEEPAPTEQPTADTGTQLRDVEIGTLKTYTHDRDLFTIDMPENWTRKDNSKPTEAIVTWTDPAENAFMQVDLFEQEQKQTKDELATFLKDYLDKTFGSQPDFAQEKAKESGPSMLIVWSYTGEGTGGVKAPLLGNSFIKQVGNKLSLFTLVVPDGQFDKLQDSLNQILGSYTINDSISLAADTSGGKLPTVDIGELETYSYKTGLFSIDVPKNWSLQDNSKPGEAILLWSEPSGNATIVVDLFEKKDKQTSEELTQFLKDFLNKTFGKEDKFTIDDPKTQKDGSVLLVWSYTDKTRGDVSVLGNSFIEQRGDKISILSTVVPEEQFDQLLDKTNEIIQSYSIDESADLP